ncbi:hypothetical protein PPRY_a1809 [Pseudoalteromonas prydzensis ACAM 620]|nr:hypothetical protein [Pseudoalteromonas prydzensis ACAM 620]
MHKFKRHSVAQQRARIRQFYQRKHAVQSAQPTQTKKIA